MMFEFGKLCFEVAKVVGTVVLKPETTTLHSAIYTDDLPQVRHLVDTAEDSDIIEDPGIDGRRAVHWATGDGETLDYLVKKCGANIGATTFNGGTALHWACREGRLEIVQRLVEHYDADTFATDNKHRTPLVLAQEKNQSAVVSYLQSRQRLRLKSPNDISWDDTSVSSTDHGPTSDSNEGQELESLLMELAKAYKKPETETTTASGVEALVDAVKHDKLSDVQAIVKRHGSSVIEMPNKDGWTAFHLACAMNNLQIARFLVTDCNANIDARQNQGNTALHLACSSNAVGMVQFLVQTCRANLEATDNDGYTPLHKASERGYLVLVQLLVEQYGANVHAKAFGTYTPLMVAQASGKDDIVAYFKGRTGNSPSRSPTFVAPMNVATLHNAINCHDLAKVRNMVGIDKSIIEAPDEENNGWTALHLACYTNRLDIAKYLIKEAGANIDARDNNGMTVLHLASSANRIDVAKFLVNMCDVNVHDATIHGYTALHLASIANRVEMIQCLVQVCGARVDARDDDGSTALHLASFHNHVEAVECLVHTCKAPVEAIDDNGSTALHDASKKNCGEVVQRLIQSCGAVVEATDNSGGTALHCASRHGHLQLATQLVEEHGADIRKADKKGRTPLELAQSEGKQDVVAYLQGRLDRVVVSVDSNVAPSVSVLTDEQKRMKAAVDGSMETFAVSEAYIKSIKTADILGRGFFGTVFRGFDPSIDSSFAIKAINKEILSGGDIIEIQRAKETFVREQETLSQFRHPNIAYLFAYSFPDSVQGNYHLVYEIAEKGSLDSFWRDDIMRRRLTFRRRIQIALDIMTALQFLHVGNKDKNIAGCFHRDVKSANIVLKHDLTAQLIDCGLAKFVVDKNDKKKAAQSTNSPKGTLGYICPEYNLGKPFQRACDVFSFGVVLVELWTGTLQNHEDDEGEEFNFVLEYIPGRRSPANHDINTHADPSFGHDTTGDAPIETVLPRYMSKFTELALDCMEELKSIPSGEHVMKELAAIRSDCAADEDGFFCATECLSADTDGPLCDLCQTFQAIPNRAICGICFDGQRQRETC